MRDQMKGLSMHIKTLLTASALVFAAVSPALAQPANNHNGSPPVDKPVTEMPMDAQSKEMMACKAMSADKAAKDPACVKLMKDRPDMMKEGGADNHNGTPHGVPAKPTN